MPALKRHNDPHARRQHILAAAEAAFNERGFHNVRLEDVAKHGRISKGTVYLYFKDKYDLYSELLKSIFEGLPTLEDPKGISPHDPPLEQLKAVVKKGMAIALQHRIILDQISVMKPDIYGRKAAGYLREHFKGHTGLTARIIQQGIHAGVLRKVDPLQAAVALVYLGKMAAFGGGDIVKKVNFANATDAVMDVFMNGFARKT